MPQIIFSNVYSINQDIMEQQERLEGILGYPIKVIEKWTSSQNMMTWNTSSLVETFFLWGFQIGARGSNQIFLNTTVMDGDSFYYLPSTTNFTEVFSALLHKHLDRQSVTHALQKYKLDGDLRGLFDYLSTSPPSVTKGSLIKGYIIRDGKYGTGDVEYPDFLQKLVSVIGSLNDLADCLSNLSIDLKKDPTIEIFEDWGTSPAPELLPKIRRLFSMCNIAGLSYLENKVGEWAWGNKEVNIPKTEKALYKLTSFQGCKSLKTDKEEVQAYNLYDLLQTSIYDNVLYTNPEHLKERIEFIGIDKLIPPDEIEALIENYQREFPKVVNDFFPVTSLSAVSNISVVNNAPDIPHRTGIFTQAEILVRTFKIYNKIVEDLIYVT